MISINLSSLAFKKIIITALRFSEESFKIWTFKDMEEKKASYFLSLFLNQSPNLGETKF